MNKKKIAIFVEGQTELIFVSDFLIKWFKYDPNIIGLNCLASHGTRLFPGGFSSFGDENSELYYIIQNVGNDESVISKIQEEATHLVAKGYELILGLRDMYSKKYVQKIKTIPPQIDSSLNKLYIDSVEQILSVHPQASIISIHHAIMEVEAWFIGMPKSLLGLDPRFTPEFIHHHSTKIDLDSDPEKTILHPAVAIAELGKVAQAHIYDKHDYEIQNMCNQLSREDYVALMSSGKCMAFTSFAKKLIVANTNPPF